jgi:hypothetical protein
MAAAKEQEMDREKTIGFVNRKNGFAEGALVTVARAEMEGKWTELLHTLPQAPSKSFQNPDGSFPYLPGWDGPIKPTS